MPLYVEIQGPANEAYKALIRFYNNGDYNAKYLRTFEHVISPLIKTGFLAQDEDYKKVAESYPLPPDNARNQYIPGVAFDLYMCAYERIMRKNHIVGGFDEVTEDPEMYETVVDPFEEYRK